MTLVREMPPGNLAYGNVTVDTTADLIRAANGRSSISIYNNGSVTVYVGDADVTTSNGMPIPAGAEREVRCTAALYGITASSSADLRWIEERH